MWLLLVVAGAASLTWALFKLWSGDFDLAALIATVTLVFVAGRFPISVPRTTFVFSGSDIFLFGAIVLIGTPAAVLAGAVDSLVGTMRRSRRLSSWIVSPATSMSATLCAGLTYEALQRVLGMLHVPVELSALAAISACGFLHHIVNTTALQWIVASKRGARLDWVASFSDSGLIGAITVVSAFLGGLLVLASNQVGAQAVAVAAGVVLLALSLLHLSFSRVEAERVKQESLVAQAQEEARINQQRFTVAFERAAGGLALVDSEGNLLRVNPAFCELLGIEDAALLTHPILDLLHPADTPELRERLQAIVGQPDGLAAMEVRLRSDFRTVWVSLHVSSFEDPGSSSTGLIYQLHDISDRRAAQEQLRFAAYHDGLTSLPNRLAFLQSLQAAIDRSKVDPTATFATLLLDLDRFKMVNDSLGHAAGNELLVEVARRLSSSVRPGDSVARLGGDEFGLMFDRIGSQQEAVSLAQRVADTIVQPMQIGGSEFTVQCSIGLTLSDLGHRSADEMIRDADIAMYDAKGKGRGLISVFDTPMHDYVADRLYMEAELRRAISAGQITLVYQPIVMLPQRRLLGFEALARWHHPEMGMVDVPKFIVLAEESGFISQLTPWVIEMASLQMAAWQRVLPDGERLKMHVNISARDLELPGFTTSVATGLARARLSGHALTLEITETSLMRSMEHALPVMESLRRIGVGFSIDDFGTGYSSLSYLSALPIDSLKIDRSFVLGMDRGPQNVEIVRAILRLGQTLHMHVIAEGVETHEHLDALRDIGVEAGQGYLFSRPLPPAKMLEQLQLAGLQPG